MIIIKTQISHPTLTYNKQYQTNSKMDDFQDSSDLIFSSSNYSLIPEILDMSCDEDQDGINYEGGISNMTNYFCPNPDIPLEIPSFDAKPDPDTIKMFVGQIPQHYTESDLLQLFEKFGKIYELRILKNKITGRSKGCCFVTFFTRKAALEAQNALHNIKILPGMHHPIQMKPADSENRNDRKLFVGMLSKEFDESDVRNLFSPYGTIEECTVLRDITGKSKGCAFVTYLTRHSAQNAVKSMHHCHIFDGCSSPLVVKFADTQKDKELRKMYLLQNDLSLQNPLSTILQQLSPDNLQSLIASNNLLQQLQSSGYLNPNPQLSVADCLNLNGQPPSWRVTSPRPVNLQNVLNNYLLNQLLTSQNLAPLVVNEAVNNFLMQLNPPGNVGFPQQTNVQLDNAFPYLSTSIDQVVKNYSREKLILPQKQIEGPDGANLFIYHLPPEFTDQNLAELFNPYGRVISAKVFVDKVTKTSKCFGFVSYDNVSSAKAAIQNLNGYHILGKKLKVEIKKKRVEARK